MSTYIQFLFTFLKVIHRTGICFLNNLSSNLGQRYYLFFTIVNYLYQFLRFHTRLDRCFSGYVKQIKEELEPLALKTNLVKGKRV